MSGNCHDDRMKEVSDALANVNEAHLASLAKSDGDFKTLLDLVKACKKACRRSKVKKTRWLQVVRVLYKRLHAYDCRINMQDSKREDGTWCICLRWDGKKNEIGMDRAYSLCASRHPEDVTHEGAAKSFIEEFCKEMPLCAFLSRPSSTTVLAQRQANYAIGMLYDELGPMSPRELAETLC